MTLDEIRERALQLPEEERELLGIALLASLETSENPADIDALWAYEMHARSEAYHSGRVVAVDAVGAIERIRHRLSVRTGM